MSDQGRTPRYFSNEFKHDAVQRLLAGEAVAAVARELGVARKLLYEWRDTFLTLGVAGFNRKRGPRPGHKAASCGGAPLEPPPAGDASRAAPPQDELAQARSRIAELERLVGRQQVDLDFFREALRLWDATSPNGGAPISTRSSKK